MDINESKSCFRNRVNKTSLTHVFSYLLSSKCSEISMMVIIQPGLLRVGSTKLSMQWKQSSRDRQQ